MNKQLLELQKYYKKKGVKCDIQKNSFGQDVFSVLFTNEDPKIIPVTVGFLDIGNQVRLGTTITDSNKREVTVHPDRRSEAINHINVINGGLSYAKLVLLDSGVISVRADIPKNSPLTSIVAVADELTECIKQAVRDNYLSFKTLESGLSHMAAFSPQDIQNVVFPKARYNGYDMASVDNFLDQIETSIMAYQQENGDLKNKMTVLVSEIERLRSLPSEPAKNTLPENQPYTPQQIEEDEWLYDVTKF